MSERLTDEQLGAIDEQCDGCSMLALNAAAQRDVRSMLAELRAHRAAAQDSHRVKVSRLADALPVDEDMDARVSRALNKRPDGYVSRKISAALSPSDVEALEWLVPQVAAAFIRAAEEARLK